MANHAQPTVGYRLALVPNQPPRIGYNRCLLPASHFLGDRLLPVPPFDKLIEDFRQESVRFMESDGRPLALSELELTDDYIAFGSASILNRDTGKKDVHYFGIHKDQEQADWWVSFKALADSAGLHLPPRSMDLLDCWIDPSNAFARWMVLLAGQGHGPESRHYKQNQFYKPFELSVRAIGRSNTLNDAAAIALAAGGLLAKGEPPQSLQFTKPEIARRYSGNQHLSRTERDKILGRLQLTQFGTNSRMYTVSLEGMTENEIRRLTIREDC